MQGLKIGENFYVDLKNYAKLFLCKQALIKLFLLFVFSFSPPALYKKGYTIRAFT